MVPVAGCHVVPPSVDTSTPATTPPPVSEAVPEIVTCEPSDTVEGTLTVEVGAVLSVDAEAAVRSDWIVPGWAPMSARRFSVACSMLRSGAVLSGFQSSRPQAHCTVPAPNTRAPLGARYMVRLCVAVPLSVVVLP